MPANPSLPALPTAQPPPPAPKVSVLIVVGTRPEAIKLIPIILALRESERFRPVVVTTGQHDLMVREVFKLAGIWADVTLWIGDTRSRLNERVASVMLRFEDFFHQWFHEVTAGDATADDVREGRYPAAVLVHGDTSSAFGAALAAFHLGVPVVHVEAGLRAGTGNMTPFPEELNRRLIARIACLHLAPTATNQENLVRENVPIKQIYVTGNSAIDALHWAARLDVPFVNPAVQETFDSERRIVLVTAHRRESWGDGLRGIGEAIARLAADHPDVSFVLPLHPNPRVRASLRPLLGRARQRAAVRARELRRVRTAARALRPRDHRLRRHPGGGARARQARARHARDHRARRGRRCRHARARRHRPRQDRRRGASPAHRPGGLRGDGAGAEPVRRRQRRRSASWRRSSTCMQAARRPRRSARASTGARCSPPPAPWRPTPSRPVELPIVIELPVPVACRPCCAEREAS